MRAREVADRPLRERLAQLLAVLVLGNQCAVVVRQKRERRVLVRERRIEQRRVARAPLASGFLISVPEAGTRRFTILLRSGGGS